MRLAATLRQEDGRGESASLGSAELLNGGGGKEVTRRRILSSGSNGGLDGDGVVVDGELVGGDRDVFYAASGPEWIVWAALRRAGVDASDDRQA